METLKTDLFKEDPTYYQIGTTPKMVQLGTYYYLSIAGQSAPEAEPFLSSIQVVYAVSYGIKFLCKAEDHDFTVPKMECHWFVDGGPEKQHLFTETPREEWRWQIKIRMPKFVTPDHFSRAMHNVRKKKPELAYFDELKFELIQEGPCAQVLHHGSYDDEGPTIERLHGFIADHQLQITGYHKEIYLSDPRRVAAEKLKTIIRYQVAPK